MNALIKEFVAKSSHKITVGESRAIEAARVFGVADYELIGEELIDMGSDGRRSINDTTAINRWLESYPAHREDLVIVSDTNLAKDMALKAALYAADEVCEYWVIDCANCGIIAHRFQDETYKVQKFPADGPCYAALNPELSLRLTEPKRI